MNKEVEEAKEILKEICRQDSLDGIKDNEDIAIKVILNHIKELEEYIERISNQLDIAYDQIPIAIQELKIDNDIMKQDLNGNILYKDELEEQYISKQKIIDKIYEYKQLLLDPQCNLEILRVIEALQELLDEENV